MSDASVVLKRAVRGPAQNVARFLAQQVNLTSPGSRSESILRRVGFVEPPTPAEIVANYLRGFVLFGKFNPRGNWFRWGWFPARAVITSKTATCPKKMLPRMRKGGFEVKYDQDLEAIIHHCCENRSEWLTPELAKIYLNMQELGVVASVGTYRDGRLVGGFWGLGIGGAFGIMSMFHLENHAGAIALAALSDAVAQQSRWSVVDCGVQNAYFEGYGARETPVEQFSALVLESMLDRRNRASSAAPEAGLNAPAAQPKESSSLSAFE